MEYSLDKLESLELCSAGDVRSQTLVTIARSSLDPPESAQGQNASISRLGQGAPKREVIDGFTGGKMLTLPCNL